MALIEIPNFEDVQTFSIIRRRADGPWGREMRCEANLHMVYTKDQFGRGLGDIWAMAYGPSIMVAFERAHEKMLKNHAKRLEERNAIPPGAVPPQRGLKQDHVVSDERLAAIASKLNLNLDL